MLVKPSCLNAAEEKKRRKARDDSHGPAGMMDCAGYGPCDVPGVPKREQTQYRWYDADKCAQVTPHQVLTRLCARMETDEPLYNDARAKFDARMNAGVFASCFNRWAILRYRCACGMASALHLVRENHWRQSKFTIVGPSHNCS